MTRRDVIIIFIAIIFVILVVMLTPLGTYAKEAVTSPVGKKLKVVNPNGIAVLSIDADENMTQVLKEGVDPAIATQADFLIIPKDTEYLILEERKIMKGYEPDGAWFYRTEVGWFPASGKDTEQFEII